jgi:hypothetical protein
MGPRQGTVRAVRDLYRRLRLPRAAIMCDRVYLVSTLMFASLITLLSLTISLFM